MSMSIQSNVQGMNSYRNMYLNKKDKEKEDEKLSSGYQINDASDDPAGLAVSEKMRADITGYKAAAQNTSMANNMVKTTEGAMQSINDMLTRAKELSTQASNGTYSDSDRAALQQEVDQITSEINRIAETTNFNGITTLDGSLSEVEGGLEFAVDAAGSGLDMVLDSVSIDPSQMQITTQEQAQEILDTLSDFVDKITSQRADLGAMDNRLDYTAQNLSTMTENLQSAESRIRDTDMAKSATESNLKSVNFKMATQSYKQAEDDKNQLLNLLGS